MDVNENNSYANLDSLNLNAAKAIADSEIDYEEVIAIYGINGLKAKEIEPNKAIKVSHFFHLIHCPLLPHY